MADSSEFKQLLQRAQRGDREAIGEIYIKYVPHVERVVRFRLRRTGLHRVTTWEDVHDSVFCQLLKPGSLDKITTDAHFRNFLLKACGNKVHDLLAKQNVRRDAARAEEAFAADVGAAVTGPEGSDGLEHDEELDRIYSQLTPRERLLCMLRRAGWSWNEIAERLNSTPVVARQVYSRGLRRARRLLRGP